MVPATMDSRPRTLTRRRMLILGAGTLTAGAVAGGLIAANTGRSKGVSTADPRDVYDPFAAGEQMPDGYFQVVGRDFIRPVYDPTFVDAGRIGWPDDADVIGVEVDGEARAYPVSFLTGREMVNDEIAGVPLLVTW